MNKREKLRARERSLRVNRLLARIRTFDDPILDEVCSPVSDKENITHLMEVGEICKLTSNGVGLAASQVGIKKRAAYIYANRKVGYLMMNPTITAKSEELIDSEEGCLSFPGYGGTVKRHKWIEVEFIMVSDDLIITDRKRRFEGFEGIVVQHEINHMDGICLIKQFYLAAKGNLNAQQGSETVAIQSQRLDG